MSLYRLYYLIHLYSFLLSAPVIRQLVLHILPSCVAQQLSTILPSPHQSYSASHSHNKCFSYCFHLHPILSSLSWKEAYVSDKKILILHHFLHYQPFGNNALSYFPTQYRSAVANNSLDIVKGRLVFSKRSRQLLTNFFVL